MKSPICPPMSPVREVTSARAQPRSPWHPRAPALTQQPRHLVRLLLLDHLVVQGLEEDVQDQHIVPGGTRDTGDKRQPQGSCARLCCVRLGGWAVPWVPWDRAEGCRGHKAVPGRAVPGRAVPGHAEPCRAVPCGFLVSGAGVHRGGHAVPCCAVPCCHAMPCHAVSHRHFGLSVRVCWGCRAWLCRAAVSRCHAVPVHVCWGCWVGAPCHTVTPGRVSS